MSRARDLPQPLPTVVVVVLLFLASTVGGAFPAGRSCAGRTLCLCCAPSDAACHCPADSPCGCHDTAKGQPPAPAPVVGIAAPLPAGGPALPAPAAGRDRLPVSFDPLTSGLSSPETPPPRG